MKRLFLFAALLVCNVTLHAQVVLTYKTHGLISGTENNMKLTTYSDPGSVGPNVRWDFSTNRSVGDFLGVLTNPSATRAGSVFSAGNTTLEEFGNLFVFYTNEQIQEQWGYLAGKGSSRIQYTKPFVKMKYPFKFGDKFSGDFAADYFVGDNASGKIVGSYYVIGDGSGTLVLPNGNEHKDVLRVREVKEYEMVVNDQRYAYVDESIRWYSQDFRYPLLVLIKSSVSILNGGSDTPSVSTKAAYSTASPVDNGSLVAENNVNNPVSVTVFPNPFYDRATITVTLPTECSLVIDVFDVSGRLVKQLVSASVSAGEHTYSFSGDKDAEGAYIVRVNANDHLSTYRIVEMK